MENDVKEFLSELLKQLKSIDYIKPEDIPNIDLYTSGHNLHGRAARCIKAL